MMLKPRLSRITLSCLLLNKLPQRVALHQPMDPDASLLDEPLKSYNKNSLYDPSLVSELADRLLKDDSIYLGFYDQSEIEALRDAWR